MSGGLGKGPLPWMKFNVGKWLSDQSIRTCTLAARGLLIDMWSIMHWAKPRGYLLINGAPMTVDDLARSAGAGLDEVGDLLRLLIARGAIAKDRRGVYYSPTMVDETKKVATAQKNGEKGGNPSLCRKRENPASDNHGDNPADKPKREEVRGKRKEHPPSSSLRSDDDPPSSESGLERISWEALDQIEPVGGWAAGRQRLVAKDAAQAERPSRRGVQLPKGWVLPEAWRRNAHAWGVPENAVDRVAARFSAHWRGQGVRRADWHAVWEGWCLEYLDRRGRDAPPAAPPPEAPDFVAPTEPELAFLLSRIGRDAYRSWFRDAEVRRDGGRVLILLPSAFVRQYAETNFAQHFPPGTRFVVEKGEQP